MSYCYVAEDPNQPGAAWGAAADRPEWAKDTAKSVKEFINDGAIVKRVTTEEARTMLSKWVRPKKPSSQQSLI